MRFVTTVVALMAMSVAAWAADNSMGTWKRNMEKTNSSIPSSNPFKSVTMVREATADGAVNVTNTGVRQDGTTASWSYTAKYDGQEYPVSGDAAFDMISMKQIDANTFTTEVKKKGGKYQTTGQVTISEDGKTYTLTAKGTNGEGKPFTQTIVYERQ